MEVGSDEYRLIRRWIAAGMPFGEKDRSGRHARSRVFPDHRVMTRNNKQQFAVYAHYSDGTVEDITRRAQYESNDQEIAVVDDGGLVRTLAMSGEAAIMVRYQEHVATFRATVPLGGKTPDYAVRAADGGRSAHRRRSGRSSAWFPRELCTDEQFIRRVSLDLTGTLPTPKQVAAFVADKDAKKRDKLVDRLLETPEYSYYFANKWADILRVKRRNAAGPGQGHVRLPRLDSRSHRQTDKPYDEFVRDILGGHRRRDDQPADRVVQGAAPQPEQFVDDAAQVFLGLRLACAQCHHHPYEKWSQDDYWGLAAFFGRVGRKQLPSHRRQSQQGSQRVAIFTTSRGTVINKRTEPARRDEAARRRADGDRRRRRPASEAGRLDGGRRRTRSSPGPSPIATGRTSSAGASSIRWTTCASPTRRRNPELLDALAKDLVDNKYSLKQLIRDDRQEPDVPAQLDAQRVQQARQAELRPLLPAADERRGAVRRRQPGDRQRRRGFGGLPHRQARPQPGDHAAGRVVPVVLPRRVRPAAAHQRLRVRARQRGQPGPGAAPAQLGRGPGQAGRGPTAGPTSWPRTRRPDAEKVEELFLWAFARKPTDEQRDLALAHIAKHASEQEDRLREHPLGAAEHQGIRVQQVMCG